MKKPHDLTTYLQHWKDHVVADVEGQQQGNHLSDDALKSLVNGVADAEQLEHLSSCPVCLERWAELVGGSQAPQLFVQPLAYGNDDEEDDVFGQGLTRQLTSPCRRFTLKLKEQDAVFTATLVVNDPLLEGQHLQVRSRDGHCFLDGVVNGGVITSRVADVTSLDLTIWTVLAVEDAS